MFANLYPPDDKSDVIFQFPNGENVRAHFFVLAAKNEIFQAMVLNDTIEKQTEIIKINDCDVEAFKIFLKHLYTDEIQKTDISLDLLKISDKYLDDSLKEKCGHELRQDINDDNVLEKLLVATKYNCESLKNAAALFVRENAELLKKPEFFNRLYDCKEAVRIVMTGFNFNNKNDYFQTKEGPQTNLSTTFDFYLEDLLHFETTLATEDLFWSVQMVQDEANKDEIFMKIESLTTYFQSCTADVEVILRNKRKQEGSFSRVSKRNTIRKGKITKICAIPSLQDATNLKNKLGEQIYYADNMIASQLTVNIEIKISFNDIVRSSST